MKSVIRISVVTFFLPTRMEIMTLFIQNKWFWKALYLVTKFHKNTVSKNALIYSGNDKDIDDKGNKAFQNVNKV